MSAADALAKAAEEWARITDEAGADNQKQHYRDLYGI